MVAQIFCTIASVTSASRMMFAFSRDGAVPGTGSGGRSRSATGCRSYAVWAIVVLSWALMIPTFWNAYVGYLVGTSIAVIGLYIAFGLPIILRLPRRETLRARRLAPRQPLQVDRLGRAHLDRLICILFLMPTVPTGIPWHDGFDWNFVNYAPITVGGALVLFGGWYVLSANKWFKGPVRQGNEESSRGSRPSTEAADAAARAGARLGDVVTQGRRAARKRGSAAVRASRSKCSSA